MTIGSGRRYRCVSAVSFSIQMTRRSPKKSNRSKTAFFELPSELKSQRRQIAEFLDENCLPKWPSANSERGLVVTWLHPAVMKEMRRRDREFFRKRDRESLRRRTKQH